MADAEGRKECIDGPHLDPSSPASVPESRRLHMILPFRKKEGENVKAFQDGFPGPGSREPLEKLLKDHPCGEHQFACVQGSAEGSHFRYVRRGVLPESHGPHAGVRQEAHDRDRSPL